MRKFLLAGVMAVASAFSAPIITVIPTLGPDFGFDINVPGSPNFDDWATNVVQGMILGTTPGSGVKLYTPLANGATLTGGEFIGTPFDSWQGVACTNGCQFTGEKGSALYFSVKITDSAGSFALDDLWANETYLGQTFGSPSWPTGSFGGAAAFSNHMVGLVSGGPNNGLLTVGGEDGSTPISALYYVGVGFTQGLDPNATGTDQERIDATRLAIQSLLNKTTQVCYGIGETSSCASVGIQDAPTSGVPEPGSMLLLGAGLAGLALLRRRSA